MINILECTKFSHLWKEPDKETVYKYVLELLYKNYKLTKENERLKKELLKDECSQKTGKETACDHIVEPFDENTKPFSFFIIFLDLVKRIFELEPNELRVIDKAVKRLEPEGRLAWDRYLELFRRIREFGEIKDRTPDQNKELDRLLIQTSKLGEEYGFGLPNKTAIEEENKRLKERLKQQKDQK